MQRLQPILLKKTPKLKSFKIIQRQSCPFHERCPSSGLESLTGEASYRKDYVLSPSNQGAANPGPRIVSYLVPPIVQVIKLFYLSLSMRNKKARASVPGKLFQSSLILDLKARPYPSRGTFRCSPPGHAPGLVLNQACQGKIVQLISIFVRSIGKGFIRLATEPNVIKKITGIIYLSSK